MNIPVPPPALPDPELVARVRQGRRDAFEPLVRRHVPALLACFRFIRVPGSVEDDMVQETFTKAFLHLDQYDPSRPFIRWLTGIGRNHYYDHCRRNQRERQLPRLSEAGGESVENQALGAVTVQALLAGLPEDSRLLAELRIFQELPYSEISQIMEIPEDQLRVRFQRLVSRLRQTVKEAKAHES